MPGTLDFEGGLRLRVPLAEDLSVARDREHGAEHATVTLARGPGASLELTPWRDGYDTLIAAGTGVSLALGLGFALGVM